MKDSLSNQAERLAVRLSVYKLNLYHFSVPRPSAEYLARVHRLEQLAHRRANRRYLAGV